MKVVLVRPLPDGLPAAITFSCVRLHSESNDGIQRVDWSSNLANVKHEHGPSQSFPKFFVGSEHLAASITCHSTPF